VSIRRKVLLGAAALVLPATFIVVEAGVASAGVVTLTGTAACTLPKIKITFTPPLHASTGGNTDTVTGKLKDCTATEAGVTKLSGSISATLSGTGTGLDGLAGGSSTVNSFTVQWKGKLAGVAFTATSTDVEQGDATALSCPGGDAGFTLPMNGGTSTVSGSFAGSSSGQSTICSATSSSTIATKGLSAGGFKSLKLVSGTIHIA